MRGIRHRRPEPVFLDRSGRRRRLVGIVGAVLGVLLAASVVVLLAGFVGGAPVAVPGLPPAGHAGQPGGPTTAPAPKRIVDPLVTPAPVRVAQTGGGATPSPAGTTTRAHGVGQSPRPHPTKSR